MTTQEFLIEFDVLYNNVTSNQAAGLTPYEKSVFLTDAQEAFVKELYSGRAGTGFEETEELRTYLGNLVDTRTYTEGDAYQDTLTPYSTVFELDNDVWFKTAERVVLDDSRLLCNGSTQREATVVPVTQDALDRTYKSPFKGPNKNRVLRLDLNLNQVEIVSKYNIGSYTVRFLRRPAPIILEDLTNGLTINGRINECTCKLHESLHRDILIRAVELAKAVWKS